MSKVKDLQKCSLGRVKLQGPQKSPSLHCTRGRLRDELYHVQYIHIGIIVHASFISKYTYVLDLAYCERNEIKKKWVCLFSFASLFYKRGE